MTNTPPKFLVCVDQHDESIAALTFACMRACTRGAVVDIVHVLPPADFQTLGMIADRMSEDRRSEGKQLLGRLSDEAEKISHVMPGLILREGNVGDELLKVVEELANVSILIIGTAHHTKGRGKLAAWLAQQLGQKLFVPLLMVPGNLNEDQIKALM